MSTHITSDDLDLVEAAREWARSGQRRSADSWEIAPLVKCIDDLRAKLQAAESALTHERAISADLRRDRDAAMALGAAAEERAIKAESDAAKAREAEAEANAALQYQRDAIQAYCDSENAMRAERDEAKDALRDVLTIVQHYQPGGSPPPGGPRVLVAFVLGVLAADRDSARRQRDEAHSETRREIEWRLKLAKTVNRISAEALEAESALREWLPAGLACVEAARERADEAVRHAETSDAMMRKARADEAQARQLIEAQTARAHESERRAVELAGALRNVCDCLEGAVDVIETEVPDADIDGETQAARKRLRKARETLAAFEALRDGGVAR